MTSMKQKKKIIGNSSKCDLLLSTGGISNSETDMIGKVLTSFGKINFWKLAIKPGRPFAFGEIKKLLLLDYQATRLLQ